MLIKNRTELTSKGFIKGRKILLDLAEQTFKEINYYNIIKKITKLEGNVLKIKKLRLNLNEVENVYIVGGGKNVSAMVLALEDILGNRIKEGVIIEKKRCKLRTKKVTLIEGGHPVPDLDGVKGAEAILEISKKTNRKDLLIVCVSGGWTSLTATPPKGIPFEEFAKVYDLLLKSGMALDQMNVIRNHLSRLGRGRIPIIAREATVVGLIAVDEVGGQPWGPTAPDDSTFQDAISILKQFDLLDLIPSSVRDYLERASPEEETPKEADYLKRRAGVHNIIIANNIDMCNIVKKKAEEKDMKSFILSTTVEGEARSVGMVMSSIAKEIAKFKRPFTPPCIVIAGGETTVTITGKAGEGGRNQEMALSAAQRISGIHNLAILSIATDGTDGPTDIAGAIVDGTTIQRAKNLKIDVMEEIKNHNTSYVLKKIKDAIYTYDTGTNLMDLMLVYVGL